LTLRAQLEGYNRATAFLHRHLTLPSDGKAAP
jgi:hypothetical protein